MAGSSGRSWNPVGDQFPAGLRVLVVDDNRTCLLILHKMLQKCNYEVTVCNSAEIALSFLRANKNGYDIVLSDVHMPDMDGFKLLEHIGLEMDLPVIRGDSRRVLSYDQARTLWLHVFKRRHKKVSEDVDHTSPANDGSNRKPAKRRDKSGSSSSKKPRFIWPVELHQQFVSAVNQLGIDKAVPKKILELMNVPGLSGANVASHLQKYRLYLRRLSGSQQLGSMDASFMGILSTGYDLQALALGGQLPGPSHSRNERVLPNEMLSYNVLNDSNQMRPSSTFPNPAFNNDSVTHGDSVLGNQDGLLSAIVNQLKGDMESGGPF